MSKTPTIENETKVSKTTNIRNASGTATIRIVEVSACGYPRICLETISVATALEYGDNRQFIELKDDRVFKLVFSALWHVAIREKVRK